MNRFTRRLLGLLFVGATLSCFVNTSSVEAAGYYRQSYSSWTYHPVRRYYYCRYNYHPVVRAKTYHHHYVIHYPSRPRYAYYYNPVRRVYWGRYDLQEGGYSMLKKEDQKGDLDAIPEKAFPEPSDMPPIPESTDDVAMAKPSLEGLPKVEAATDSP